jgi:hypothetical protein
MRMKRLLLNGCLAFAAGVARGDDSVANSAPQTETLPLHQANGFSGKVAETTNAASYTYVCVDTGTKKVWAAAPQFAVRVGDSVMIADGMPMPNYHSKTLDRTFEVVYFTDGVVVNGAKPGDGGAAVELPKNHPPITSAATQPKPETKLDLSGIKKAGGGKTIAEIFAGKAKLTGQQVTVRGKVVKYNAMIMGKNWFHLRDGSGSEGSNDLTVTTASEVKLGDTVLVSGIVSADKDFGAGYRYALMIEKAKVVVE